MTTMKYLMSHSAGFSAREESGNFFLKHIAVAFINPLGFCFTLYRYLRLSSIPHHTPACAALRKTNITQFTVTSDFGVIKLAL
jgi:hypothetical protein